MKTVNVGQRVKVMNQGLNGASFVEGEAVIKKIHEDMGNGMFACDVRFDDDSIDVFRWVDAEIQNSEKIAQ